MQARDAARNREVVVDVSHEVVMRARFSSRDSNARRGVAMIDLMSGGWLDGWTHGVVCMDKVTGGPSVMSGATPN